ncbi:hypothetical protein [Succinimonas sp.]|uniref:hypothetical protein n=1 Tax=Succinimonas sp. TaxID=1936151 RepID=UPI00386F5A83
MSGTTFKKLRKEHFFEAGDLETGADFSGIQEQKNRRNQGRTSSQIKNRKIAAIVSTSHKNGCY